MSIPGWLCHPFWRLYIREDCNKIHDGWDSSEGISAGVRFGPLQRGNHGRGPWALPQHWRALRAAPRGEPLRSICLSSTFTSIHIKTVFPIVSFNWFSYTNLIAAYIVKEYCWIRLWYWWVIFSLLPFYQPGLIT